MVQRSHALTRPEGVANADLEERLLRLEAQADRIDEKLAEALRLMEAGR